ncbi:MAG: alpha-L-fucosidase [Planctomycetaceae bacterium]|nr:alpha-L-fucosidase [Planctomycetaceae bacterium]
MRQTIKTFFIALLAGTSMTTSAPADDPGTPPPLLPTPSARQLAWHDRGMYAFVHFNMNTFTDQEWGHGDESPETFLPTELDTDQWCRVFKDAGMTGVIITAKHHDGFCLWPSEHTDHDVQSSRWRDGKGDVLKDLSESCRKFGLDFGVYLSPWDRNHPLYGTGDAYNDFFVEQLREVLTDYGPVFEVWFDGANGEGPNGRRQTYDFKKFHDVVRELQPDACIFSDAGPDVRWIGNERGIVGETNWNLLKRDDFFPGIPGRNRELNEGQIDGTHWLPGEADVSIRPGWYYHQSQDDQVKNLEQLLEIWYGSIGRGANLLLNFPVDRRGLVHENDTQAVLELRAAIDTILAEDLARGRPATSEQSRSGGEGRFGAAATVDGDPTTYWAARDGASTGTVEIALARPSPVDHVEISEHLPLGQRVKSFTVQCRTVDGWTTVARGTTIGNRRIVRFPAVMANRIRVVIEDARAAPTISNISVHSGPPRVEIVSDQEAFLDRTEVYLAGDRDAAVIHYTLDGSIPTRESPRHLGGPIGIDQDAVLKAVAYEGDRRSLAVAEQSFRRFDPSTLKEATHPIGWEAPRPGMLEVAIYEGGWQSLHDLPGRVPVKIDVADQVNASPRTRDEHCCLVFEGFLRVRETGVHTLHLASDDGSRLFIDDEIVIDNDGLHGLIEKSVQLPLKQGWHPIRVEWFNATGGLDLSLELEGPGVHRRPVRAADLSSEAGS